MYARHTHSPFALVTRRKGGSCRHELCSVLSTGGVRPCGLALVIIRHSSHEGFLVGSDKALLGGVIGRPGILTIVLIVLVPVILACLLIGLVRGLY